VGIAEYSQSIGLEAFHILRLLLLMAFQDKIPFLAPLSSKLLTEHYGCIKPLYGSGNRSAQSLQR
tara:strand:- start:528 stop:722 length:195 start_codon:yes stop_codon:yes gene_type:complete